MEKTKIQISEEGFRKISVYLTGFSENELLATGMSETYYYTIMKEPDQDTVRAFFIKAQMILAKYESDETELLKQISQHLLPDSHYLKLARRIILLWYTGIWTSIRVITEETAIMVSAESYMQGLIWTTAQTHPAGAKQPGFASWSKPPL